MREWLVKVSPLVLQRQNSRGLKGNSGRLQGWRRQGHDEATQGGLRKKSKEEEKNTIFETEARTGLVC